MVLYRTERRHGVAKTGGRHDVIWHRKDGWCLVGQERGMVLCEEKGLGEMELYAGMEQEGWLVLHGT